MTYDPAKPRYTLKFGGKSYELVGTFAVIEAAEYALKDHIINISMRCTEMPVSDIVKLLSSILSACGEKITVAEIRDTIWNEIGIGSTEYVMLGLHLHSFLRITIAKPEEREAATKRMGEILGKMTEPSPSLGETTDSSA